MHQPIPFNSVHLQYNPGGYVAKVRPKDVLARVGYSGTRSATPQKQEHASKDYNGLQSRYTPEIYSSTWLLSILYSSLLGHFSRVRAYLSSLRK